MRLVQTAWICFLGACLFTPVSRLLADAQPNQYDVISERNIFKLRPMVVAPPADSQKDPPSKVTLTGITDILGGKMALMEVQPQGGKPKLFLMLAEGQRDGDVSLISIDQKAGTVTIKNQDVTQTLDMADAGKRAASAPAVAGGGSPIPSPTGGGGGVNSIRDVRARGIDARRDLRTVSSGDVPALPGSGNTTSLPSSGDMASGGTAIGTNPRTLTAQSQGKIMSPEEQIVKMEIDREVNKNNPNYPPLPPAPPAAQRILNQPAQ